MSVQLLLIEMVAVRALELKAGTCTHWYQQHGVTYCYCKFAVGLSVEKVGWSLTEMDS